MTTTNADNIMMKALIEYKWDEIASYMDDEKRETVHFGFAPCSKTFFLAEYLKLDPDFADLLDNEFGIGTDNIDELIGDDFKDMTEIARNAVGKFFKDYEQEIQEGGKAFIRSMFGDKGPGSFDAIYLIGYDKDVNYNTDFNDYFCEVADIDFDFLVKFLADDDMETEWRDVYEYLYEKATALAEKYAYTLI